MTHSRDGLKWFKYVCQHVNGLDEAATIAAFHDTVRRHFRGALKGPFNKEDRYGLWFCFVLNETPPLEALR